MSPSVLGLGVKAQLFIGPMAIHIADPKLIGLQYLPSRELTCPTFGKGKSSTQKQLEKGWYVSSQEGIGLQISIEQFSSPQHDAVCILSENSQFIPFLIYFRYFQISQKIKRGPLSRVINAHLYCLANRIVWKPGMVEGPIWSHQKPNVLHISQSAMISGTGFGDRPDRRFS